MADRFPGAGGERLRPPPPSLGRSSAPLRGRVPAPAGHAGARGVENQRRRGPGATTAHRGGAACGDRAYPRLPAAGGEGRATVRPRQPALGAILPAPPRRAARGHQRRRALRKAQLRGAVPMVGRARPHAGARPRVHRGRQHAEAGVPRSPVLLLATWSSWTPRRMDPGVSSSSSGRSSGSPCLHPVKPEPQDTPVSRRTHSSSVRIGDSTPASGRLVLVAPKPLPGLPAEYEEIARRGFSDEDALQ